MTVAFAPSEDGFVVHDTIEQRQCIFETSSPVDPVPEPADSFVFPVDDAVTVAIEELTLAAGVSTTVRDEEGTMLAEVGQFETVEFPRGTYYVELSASIKLYLRLSGPLTIEAGFGSVRVRTEDGVVHVGARSHHEHPQATITTTEDPHDLMRAITAFGSALKTTSPERSFPTLRGHPPELRLGDELSIPEGLTVPETDIRIEVPPTLRTIYPVATLTYYLGAELVPGPEPKIVTDEGFEYEFDAGAGFERQVEEVLKQTFLLDCITRTEGFYRIDLKERRAVERAVDLDYARLYDLPPAERLEAYLEVPFDVLEPHVPEWKLTTHVAPTAENAELLPFLVNDLAIVRLPHGHEVSASKAQLAAINEFTRDFTRSAAGAQAAERTRSAADARASASTPTLIEPESTDSLEQAWAGEHTPVGASQLSIEAFRNKLARGEPDGDIDITVVCNDPAMDEEQLLASEVYGSRDVLPFDVQVYHDLSTAALRAVIETDGDFLHYIGHIDDDGFECTDGRLDVHDLDTVGVDAFFLNACTSYEQGMALIERGAIGGVVTLADVLNSGAIEIGRTMVRLLNQGFPLRAALNIAEDSSVVGGHYIVVGDGNVDIAQAEGVTPMFVRARPVGDLVDVYVHAYPASQWGMGSLTSIHLAQADDFFLTSGEIDAIRMTTGEFLEFLSLDEGPVYLDDTLYWSSEISEEDLRSEF